MKKEDLIKPCSAEKRGLKIELNNYKLISFLLLLSLKTFPQVPINGFCKFNRFDVDSGFTNLYALNYNDDSYTDLVLFNPAKKEIETIEGNPSPSFSNPVKYRIPSEISSLHNIPDKNNKVIGYAYSSRKRMKLGLVSFARNGRPSFTNEIKLNSYPENISVSDIKGDFESEILISGKSFDGLSIITNQNRRLKEKKIVANTVYSFSQFIDISRDGFPDIAAFNLSSLNLDLFYNKGNGEFNKVRSIPISENIYSLHTYDIDLDYMEDIIFSKGNSIEILYGDFNSSYEVKKVFNTEYSPEKIIVGDFNKDGKMDIAYLDTKRGVLSVLFGKDNRDFYPEVIYFRKPGSMDLIPFYSKFINGIAVLNKSGALNLISTFTSDSDESDISLGTEQKGINYFDHNHDGIPDLCFIDNNEKKLNIILRNSSGIPSVFYSIPLLSEESKIYPDYYEKHKTAFYCYSEGKKLIESVSMDFDKPSNLERKSFYVPDNIFNVKAEHNEENEVKFFVVQLENSNLNLTVFNSITKDYLNTNYTVAKNVINVSYEKENLDYLYFWQNNHDSLILYRASFNNNFENPEIKYTGLIKEVIMLHSFAGNFIINNKDADISYFHAAYSNQVIISAGSFINMISKKEINEELEGTPSNQYYVGALNFKGLDKLFFNSTADNKIKMIDLVNKGRNVVISPVADVKFAGDYFIKNLNMRSFHLVYINTKENCITVKQLR
jgi:hypothetical protein